MSGEAFERRRAFDASAHEYAQCARERARRAIRRRYAVTCYDVDYDARDDAMQEST